MTDGPTHLEQRIELFQNLLEEMKEATQDAHSVLKQIRIERREIDRLFMTTAKERVDERVSELVKTELEKLSVLLNDQSGLIYDKVGRQIDKLIKLSLGDEFSVKHGHEDVRPMLAAKLREWIHEIIEEEG